LKRLAPVVPLIRLLLDTADPALAGTVHAQAPQKSPLLRTLALNDIGKAGIPLSTGMRVGIGESPESWIEAASAINRVLEKYGNVRAFHVVPFVPEPFSPMADNPPVTNDLFRQAVKVVRQHLVKEITVVAEVYQRLALAPEGVISGAFDLGPIRIADNERFDVDMLNAVNGVRELLTKIHVDMKCVPVIRDKYKKDHRLASGIEANLERFNQIGEDSCIVSGTSEQDTILPAGSA
jgi:2-iminoacetate synthase ThiH